VVWKLATFPRALAKCSLRGTGSFTASPYGETEQLVNVYIYSLFKIVSNSRCSSSTLSFLVLSDRSPVDMVASAIICSARHAIEILTPVGKNVARTSGMAILLRNGVLSKYNRLLSGVR